MVQSSHISSHPTERVKAPTPTSSARFSVQWARGGRQEEDTKPDRGSTSAEAKSNWRASQPDNLSPHVRLRSVCDHRLRPTHGKWSRSRSRSPLALTLVPLSLLAGLFQKKPEVLEERYSPTSWACRGGGQCYTTANSISRVEVQYTPV